MSIRCPKYRYSQRGFITLAITTSWLFTPLSSYAAEYDYLIEATVLAEQIDNPRRANSSDAIEDQDEFLSQQTLRATLSRATSKLITNIDYQGSKNNYREDLLTDRSFVTGVGAVEWIIAPERLSWNLSNTRSLQIVDSLLPDTIDNRQVISLTSTGPRATLQISGRNKLTGSVNYSIADYERSGLDSQDRLNGELLLSHNFSTQYISSLGGNYLQSEVDNVPLLDFERYEYFWQNEYVTEVFDVNLMLGQTVLVRDNVEDQENLLIRLIGNYKLNSQSSLGFNYSESYEDIFSNMLSTANNNPSQLIGTPNDPTQFIGDRLGNSFLNQNYELVQKGINYTYTRSEFFNMNLGYSESDRAYDGAATIRNQADKTYSVGTNWKFFENLDFSLYGRYTEQEFPDITTEEGLPALNREQERTEYGLRASYRISKSLYTQFRANQVHQSGTLFLDDYSGLNYSISLTYALGN